MSSPFTPTHQRRFTANRFFTDRERPVTLFLRALDPPPPPASHRVLVFYGVGGEGKTALVRHLLGLLEREYAARAGWAAVNFENAAMRQPAEALLSIRLQLRKTAGLPFPAFDTAFAHWFGRTYPGDDIRQRHPGLFRRPSEDAKDALDFLPDLGGLLSDALDEVPGLGFIYKNLHRVHGRYGEWLERRGKTVLAGIESLQPDQLLDRLPTFLGADIADAIAAMKYRTPLVVIADTMEAFHRAEGQKAGPFAFRNDRWLRDLVKETPGVLFLLLGRDRLRWAEVEPGWEQVLDQHRLGALSPADADLYLTRVPVTEPAIRARMVEGAAGLPFYLDLQVDLYERLKNQGQTPDPAQFGGSEPEILTRFLDHLGGDAARALTVLAHARRLDEPLWLHLGQAFMGGLPPFSFAELRAFSFTEEQEAGWLTLHALMREALCERTKTGEPTLHEQIHRRLFAWWDARCQPPDPRSLTPVHELALPEVATHRAAFDRSTFGDWAATRGKPFHDAARYALAQTLFEQALAIEEVVLTPDDQKIARTLSWLGNILQLRGDLAGALARQERALAIQERALGPDHPQVAGTLGNLGNILRLKGDLAGALARMERVLVIFERALGPDHPQVAGTLGNLGIILEQQGDLAGALARMERALAIEERALGPDHPEVAITLFNLSGVEEQVGATSAARERRTRALTILLSRLGEQHPHTETVRRSLAAMDAAAPRPRRQGSRPGDDHA